MTPLPEIPADAGITLLLPLPAFGGRDRVVAAWTQQLERLNRPFSVRVTESDRVGESLKTEPEYPIVVLVVPEFAYRPSDLPLLIDALSKADLVLGVRPTQPRPAWLSRLGAVGSWISRVVFGIDLGDRSPWYGGPAWRTKLYRRLFYGLRAQDAESGLRVWRRDSLSDMPVQSQGRFALVEMIAKLNFRGGLIVEIALSRPGDLPTAPPFPSFESDEREVFRKPAFRRPATAQQKDPGESDSPGSVAAVSD